MKINKQIILVFLTGFILFSSPPGYARRVKDKGEALGTYIDKKGLLYRIVVVDTSERLKVQAQTEDGRAAGWAYIDKYADAQRAIVSLYFRNEDGGDMEIESSLEALLFKALIGEAREKRIFSFEIKLNKTVTGIFLETLRDSGYIIKLKFYPKVGAPYATFEIPATLGVIPDTGERKVP